MTTNFNWQTDEDDNWDVIEAPPPPPRQKRRWPRSLLSLLLVIAAITALVWQLTRQVDEAATSVSEDVLASHDIVVRAAAGADLELFTSVLSGRDAGWTEAEKQLLRSGRLLDFPQFGLHWLEAAPVDAAAVTTSPDLQAATVVSEQRYAVAIGNGLTETIRLRRDDVYRLGSNRWLLAPPLADYWGPERTIDTGRITLIYPDRDAAFAEAFALDLDEKVAELCRLYAAFDCSNQQQLRVEFDIDPGTLYSSTVAEVAWQPATDLILPTPSLLGTPVDDAAYHALFRGYTAAILQRAIGAWVGYSCCEQGLLFQALVDFQLDQLALRPWPLSPADYEQLLLGSEALLFDTRIWDAAVDPTFQSDLWPYAYGLIALSQSTSMRPSLVQMERELDLPGGYLTWINRFLTLTSFERDFERSWRQFIYANSESINQPQPIAWPQQDIYLACTTASEPETVQIVTFSPITGRQQMIMSYPVGQPQTLTGLPDDNGLIIEGGLDRLLRRGQHVTILRLGAASLTFQREDNDDPPYYTGFHDPTGRRLVLGHVTDGGQSYSLLNLDTCTEASCPLQPLAGIPVWSPDGSTTLIYNEQDNLLLGDSSAQVIDQFDTVASAPIWLDNQRFVYLQAGRLFSGHTDLRPPTELLSPDLQIGMAQALGLDEADAADLRIRTSLRHPQHQAQLLLAVAHMTLDAGAIFTFDTVQQTVSLQFEAVTYVPVPITLTQPENTNWLQFWQAQVDDVFSPGEDRISLFSLTDGQEPLLVLRRTNGFTEGKLDWSSDGQWLALARGDYLHFIAPAYGYQRIVFLPTELNCANAVWVNINQALVQAPPTAPPTAPPSPQA